MAMDDEEVFSLESIIEYHQAQIKYHEQMLQKLEALVVRSMNPSKEVHTCSATYAELAKGIRSPGCEGCNLLGSPSKASITEKEKREINRKVYEEFYPGSTGNPTEG